MGAISWRFESSQPHCTNRRPEVCIQYTLLSEESRGTSERANSPEQLSIRQSISTVGSRLRRTATASPPPAATITTICSSGSGAFLSAEYSTLLQKWSERTGTCPLGVPCHCISLFYLALQVEAPRGTRSPLRPESMCVSRRISNA